MKKNEVALILQCLEAENTDGIIEVGEPVCLPRQTARTLISAGILEEVCAPIITKLH